MTKDEQIGYVRISLNLAGIPADSCTAELIIELTDMVRKKKGKTNIGDIVKAEYAVKDKHNVKVSDKRIEATTGNVVVSPYSAC